MRLHSFFNVKLQGFVGCQSNLVQRVQGVQQQGTSSQAEPQACFLSHCSLEHTKVPGRIMTRDHDRELKDKVCLCSPLLYTCSATAPLFRTPPTGLLIFTDNRNFFTKAPAFRHRLCPREQTSRARHNRHVRLPVSTEYCQPL